jgi:hypothetical protein
MAVEELNPLRELFDETGIIPGPGGLEINPGRLVSRLKFGMGF